MSTFKTLKMYMNLLGILQLSSTQEKQLLYKVSNGIAFATFVQFWLTTSWYLAFEADSFIEYAQCAAFVLTSTQSILWYFMLVSQRKDKIEFFTRLDAMIENSKFDKKYFWKNGFF